MADMSFKDIVVGFLLVSLVVVSTYHFTVGVGENYGYSADVFLSQEQINFSGIENQMRSTSEQADSWQKSMKEDKAFISTDSIILLSIFGTAKLIWDAVTVISKLLFGGLAMVFGVDPMVIGVIMAIMIIVVFFAIWRTVKVGE